MHGWVGYPCQGPFPYEVNNAVQDCIFCKIVRGEIPSTKVYEDDLVMAFKDIQPQAPTHILVIPKKHLKSIMDLSLADGELINRMFAAIRAVVKEQGVVESGFRLVTNTGAEAGQVVHHLHFHILGGTKLRMMG